MPFNDKNEWKPTKKQAALLSVPFTVREAAILGGAGIGKSELLLMFPIVHGFHTNPRFKQLFLRRTSKQLKKEIVPRSQEIYTKFGAKFNESDMLWIFPRLDNNGQPLPGESYRPTGARVYLGHCENESDVHIYDSMEINLFTPDEITSLTYWIYSYIGFTRVRSSDPNLPAIIRACGMPGDIGHGWVKKRFIDPAPQGEKLLVGKGGNQRIYIHATLLDNPHIDPNYKQGLEALPEAEKQAKLYGSWDSYSGQVFEEFRDVQYPDEPDNALHICKPFSIPDWWPRIVSIDWGYAAKNVVLWGAISPSRKLYVYRCQSWRGKKFEEWAPEAKFFIDKEKPSEIKICHSANQNRGDSHTIIEQVSEALGSTLVLGEKNRPSGKLLLHEYLRWQAKPVLSEEVTGKYDPEIAAWIQRNKTQKEYEQYLAVFNHRSEAEDIPRIQFFDTPDVKNVINSVKACCYAKDSADGKKKEDVAEFDGDDEYDALRMLLHSADNFFGVANSQAEKLNKTEEIALRLRETGDMTQFYRNMRKLEVEEVVKPISRFHRGRRAQSYV